MTISIRASKEEEALYKDLASFYGISVSSLIRKTMAEMIEDYYDTKDAEEAYREYLESGEAARPIEELWEEVGI